MKEKQVLNNAENFVVTRGSALICAVLFMGVLLFRHDIFRIVLCYGH